MTTPTKPRLTPEMLAELRASAQRAIEGGSEEPALPPSPATLLALIDALEEAKEALRKIAEEPLGGTEASHADVLRDCEDIARAALEKLEEER